MRYLASLIFAFSLTVLLTGCGGGDSGGSSNTTTDLSYTNVVSMPDAVAVDQPAAIEFTVTNAPPSASASQHATRKQSNKVVSSPIPSSAEENIPTVSLTTITFPEGANFQITNGDESNACFSNDGHGRATLTANESCEVIATVDINAVENLSDNIKIAATTSAQDETVNTLNVAIRLNAVNSGDDSLQKGEVRIYPVPTLMPGGRTTLTLENLSTTEPLNNPTLNIVSSSLLQHVASQSTTCPLSLPPATATPNDIQPSSCTLSFTLNSDTATKEYLQENRAILIRNSADNPQIVVEASNLKNLIYPDVRVIADASGHLLFTKNGEPIQALDLSGDPTGTIHVWNIGGDTIQNFQLDLGQLSEYIDANTCTSLLLSPDRSCTFTYDVSNASEGFQTEVKATGLPTTVDNTPLRLFMSLSAKGQFTFLKNGQEINQLHLKPGSEGTITLKNTGNMTIDQYYLDISSAFQQHIIPGSQTCADGSKNAAELEPNESCQFSYLIPEDDTNDDFYAHVVAKGTNTDNVANSPKDLPVVLTQKGHLVFYDTQGFPAQNVNLNPGSSGTITLRNTGGTTIKPFELDISNNQAFAGYVTDNTCADKLQLTPKDTAGDRCYISYNIPQSTTENPVRSSQSVIEANGNPQDVDETPVPLTVNIASLGHFTFTKDKQIVSQLQLTPNDTDTVTLHNTGGTDINDFSLVIPLQLQSDGFTDNGAGGCGEIATLKADASCTFSYIVPSSATDLSAQITAEGDQTAVDNNFKNLPVTISRLGHFLVTKGGQPVSTLPLKPGDSGTVEITNTGGESITDFNLVIPLVFLEDSYIVSNTCNGSTLAPGENNSCYFSYSIPEDIDSSGEISGKLITVTGDSATVDNEVAIPASVSLKGNFVFTDANGDVLNNGTISLSPGSSGWVTLTNTGGTDITNFSLTIPQSLTPYIDDNNCADKTQLNTGSSESCSFHYTVENGPAVDFSGELTATGDPTTVNVTPVPMTLSISSKGHFVFSQIVNGSPIPVSQLNLKKGDQGEIVVTNAGGMDISDFNLTIPSALRAYIDRDQCAYKVNPDQLAQHESCNFHYNITGDANLPELNITATGDVQTVNNTPTSLPVKLSSLGNIVFATDPQGDDLIAGNQLNLTPNGSGIVYVVNKGNTAATGFSLDVSNLTGITISSNNCTGSSLAVGDNCSFSYSTTGAQTGDGGVISATATASTVEQTPVNLTMTVTQLGHFGFYDQDGNPVSSLNLTPNTVKNLVIKNDGDTDITDFYLALPADASNYLTGDTCKDLSDDTLSAGSTCTVTYTVGSTVASISGDFITVRGNSETVDNTPDSIPLTSTQLGYFRFTNANHQPITSLTLQPNKVQKITLDNVGGTAITNFSLIIPASYHPYLSEGGNCPADGSALPVNQPCTLTFDTTDTQISPPSAPANLVASGDQATVKNNAHALALSYASLGELVFATDAAGTNQISDLSFAPNQSQQIYVVNLGGASASDFSLDTSSVTGGTITDNSCATTTSLAANNFCSFIYTTSADAKTGDGGAISASADANTVEQTPVRLTMSVSDLGHLGFYKANELTPVYSLDLLANSGDTTVVVKNTGDTDITNFNLSLPTDADDYLTNNTCANLPDGTLTAQLGDNSSCSFTYTVSTVTQTVSDQPIQATGDSGTVDNSGLTIPLTISQLGKFRFSRIIDGPPISSLPLAPDQKGDIYLKNVGNTAITSFAVSIPAAYASYIQTVGDSCQSPLLSGSTCVLSYNTTGATDALSADNIVASGDSSTVENSDSLSVNLSAIGHFVFSSTSDGSDPYTGDAVSIVAGDGSGSPIYLVNTGGTDITNFSAAIPSTISPYVTANTCSQNNTLSAGGYCQINYSVPASSDGESAQPIIASTTDNGTVDNNNQALSVSILSSPLVFASDEQGQDQMSSLISTVGQTGTIYIFNEGIVALNNFSYTILDSSYDNQFSTGTCTITNSLAVGSYCTIGYDFTGVSAFNTTISINADNTDYNVVAAADLSVEVSQP